MLPTPAGRFDMRIVRAVLQVGVIALLLYSVIVVLGHPRQRYKESESTFVFSKGNAPDEVRAEIVGQLREFQEGYRRRDTSRLQPFMDELFAKADTLVLGTQPREVVVGRERVSRLIASDWRSWGDCTFQMDRAHISTAGNVAWVATIGYVQFDMCQYLVLPLRLSAVMVAEDGVWRFQYMQFQFDLDCSPLLATIGILLLWLPISLVQLTVVIVGTFRQPKHKGSDKCEGPADV
jgi:hypothetical protein